MIKRRRLGSTYTRSPAQNVQTAMAGNFSKVLFTIFIIIVYLGVVFMVTGIVKFLGTEFGNMPPETRTIDLYKSTYCFPVKVIGIIIIIIYVFRDKMTNR